MDWNIFWACFWQLIIATPVLVIFILLIGASLALVFEMSSWGRRVKVIAQKPTAGVYFASPFEMEMYWRFHGTIDAFNFLHRKIEAETGVAGLYDFNTDNLMAAADGTTRIEWRRISEEVKK